MPSSSRLTELCRYHYDPLDRQTGCTLTLVQPATLQRFYCTSRLATEIHGAVRTSLFQHDDQLLAQQRHQNDQLDTTLLATDQQRTVLSALDAIRPHPLAYTPYGHRPPENGLLSLLGFNGQRPDPVTGHYHLGNGYRQFNPVLMRFNSPDSWSPFGEGGINAYTYCGGEPVNRTDSNGHDWLVLKALRKLNIIKKKTRVPKELVKYNSVEHPITKLEKKTRKQMVDDFNKGIPSEEKLSRREGRYWINEKRKHGKTPSELIAEAEEKFKKNLPPETLNSSREPVKTHVRNRHAPLTESTGEASPSTSLQARIARDRLNAGRSTPHSLLSDIRDT
ncbi:MULTISPECIES: RHS repeat-associated core domain-containing protein [unclassified Pseudomonas]|uniref:RHS repeat-associated core domain-containing protein n=1 Tax=unclassified Pseudomonas TaxID=196821 RepID=UPI00135A0D9D|nr:MULTISPECIES: RHS repeat-associated core domain-containing protein [unclassified Pseudomonas]